MLRTERQVKLFKYTFGICVCKQHPYQQHLVDQRSSNAQQEKRLARILLAAGPF